MVTTVIADLKYCKRNDDWSYTLGVTQAQAEELIASLQLTVKSMITKRAEFFDSEGYMADDEAILGWYNEQ